jgi:glutamate synthase domain-containing protein 1/glutamate synthase domain-containing protein 3
MSDLPERILASRRGMVAGAPGRGRKAAEEGGCGVVGFAASVPVRGRHIFEPSVQMHNRGNGKGGGIAAAGLVAEQMLVDKATLRNDYLLQIALLDPDVVAEVERERILPHFVIDQRQVLEPVADYRELGLEVKPPDVVRYFVRVKESVLARFAEENSLGDAAPRELEDEYVYRNTYQLNESYYASLGEKRAFVLSHGRDLMIFKIVGYAEEVVRYYGLEDVQAHVWIAHQRYPTKGRVWHPAGAHPFIGMNEALVHNGDFANYHGITEYLRQHNIAPLFLTDTEVSVLLFDLWDRVYRYPTEYVIEALAPTTEMDFDRLPPEKKQVYRAIQALHMHGSPDGPWFFIIARSDPDRDRLELLGITDTSMLRPQVFALQDGEVSIGLVASEKQAIDATLQSLSGEDPRFRLVADRYWNARGGSHTDGGSFSFSVKRHNGHCTIVCADKFGKVIEAPPGNGVTTLTNGFSNGSPPLGAGAEDGLQAADAATAFACVAGAVAKWDGAQLQEYVRRVVAQSQESSERFDWAMDTLALLVDRRYDCGEMKGSVVRQLAQQGVAQVLDRVPPLGEVGGGSARRIDWETRSGPRPPKAHERTLVVCAEGFPAEGEECDSRLLVSAYLLGWKRFIVYGLRGQRFLGCGFGPGTEGVRIDVFGSSGDYLASGIDGMEIHVHGNGQDQLGQIMKRGTLVVHGDVGQTFMYGAKGGKVYVAGNAAGRPLINAVGKPRVVINGTCLDFLAESFMAGDPHNGGGFVILNGVEFDAEGSVRPKDSPYPGSNLFSLASGGAVFIRDPKHQLDSAQLNGGELAQVDEEDWNLVFPYLQENEHHFGVSVDGDLLTVDGARLPPREVYRRVRAARQGVLCGHGQGMPVPAERMG